MRLTSLRNFYFSGTILLFVIIFQSCSSSQQKTSPISIGFKFHDLTKFIYLTDSRINITQTVAGLNTEMQQHMQLQSAFTVDSLNDSTNSLTVAFERFYIKSKSSEMTIEFDSRDRNKQPNELLRLADMVNQPFRATIDKWGRVSTITSFSPDTIVSNTKAFTDTAMRGLLEPLVSFYPNKPVSVGDEWQRSFYSNAGFVNLRMTVLFQLESVHDHIANISLKGAATSISSGDPQMRGMKLKLSGTQQGTLEIDTTTGLIQNAHFTQNISGTISIPNAEIPMTISSDTRIVGKVSP
ncbi:MAG: hypothetical protein JSS64_11815 [Bacteroidetes bacterium]|nr:hypothetical protein [Bacteroidota bacterium]